MLDLARRTVIVVDDEAFTRQTVARLLTSLGAVTIVQAEDGEAALAASWTVDAGPVLIISDFNMPKIDGLDLLRSVRMGQSGLDRAVPFVMLTAYSDRDVVDAALKLDVSAFLVKPVSRAALEKRLGHLARSETETGWLKPVDVYGAVTIEMAPEVFAEPSDPHAAAPSHDGAKAASKPGARKSHPGAAHDPEEAAQALARGPSSASDDGADLLKFLLANKRAAGESSGDTDETETGRAGLLALAAEHADSIAAMTAGIDGLAAEIGAPASDLVAGALVRLASSGAVTASDLIDTLRGDGDTVSVAAINVGPDWAEQTRSLGDIPKKAVTAQNIFMRDGSLLFASGAPLAGRTLRVLNRLEKLGILDLPSDPAVGRCVIRLLAPAEPKLADRPPVRAVPRPAAPVRRKGPERAVGPTEIAAGMVLSRDVQTIHGAVYLGLGTTLTERHVGVLESLYEAGKLTSKIWISV